MCGIIGSNFHSAVELNERLKLIIHRGPDFNNIIEHQGFMLGHCRLAIQDLSNNCRQPYQEDKLAMVYNGELWNNCLQELQHLKDQFIFHSESDTEYLFYGFESYGSEIFAKLDGVFGVAFVNDNGLYLARDFIGEIPLYYYHNKEKFFFASELKAFAGLSSQYIKLLLPGHFLHFKKDHTITITQYYNLPNQEITDNKETIIANFKPLLISAVKKRIPKEVPYCVLLSGGIDSTIIAYLLQQENSKIEAFTIHLDIGADKKKLSNDLYFARMAAKAINIKLNEVIMTEQNVLDSLEETVKVIEDKSWTQVSSGLPHLLMGKFIQNNSNFKVIFSGSGSDEIFASYPSQKRWQWQDDQYDKGRRGLVSNIHKTNTIRENKCLMASSKEIRSPFLDRDFIEYALNIPIKYRFDNKRMKPMLRYAFQDQLPKELVWREKVCEGLGVGIEEIIKSKKSEIKEIFERHYK